MNDVSIDIIFKKLLAKKDLNLVESNFLVKKIFSRRYIGKIVATDILIAIILCKLINSNISESLKKLKNIARKDGHPRFTLKYSVGNGPCSIIDKE